MISAGVLSPSVADAILTVTLMVLLPGALWFVPAAHFTVIVTVPVAFAVMVIVVPLTLTVAIPVLLEDADMAPFPALVAVTVAVFVPPLSVTLLLLRDRLPAAFPMVQLTVLAVVLPSLNL